ncbi:hypothetical protein EVAR_51773_1 [Eumeta japonica]|uniref:Uncharacterized protein n=1 Tax=Eumeta variegata TaxID=151549 RepID=A0A4C1XFH1_EUMVA|nr:hypothetical protein EVAR_51773_1 [Eumeta japonica]
MSSILKKDTYCRSPVGKRLLRGRNIVRRIQAELHCDLYRTYLKASRTYTEVAVRGAARSAHSDYGLVAAADRGGRRAAQSAGRLNLVAKDLMEVSPLCRELVRAAGALPAPPAALGRLRHPRCAARIVFADVAYLAIRIRGPARSGAGAGAEGAATAGGRLIASFRAVAGLLSANGEKSAFPFGRTWREGGRRRNANTNKWLFTFNVSRCNSLGQASRGRLKEKKSLFNKIAIQMRMHRNASTQNRLYKVNSLFTKLQFSHGVLLSKSNDHLVQYIIIVSHVQMTHAEGVRPAAGGGPGRYAARRRNRSNRIEGRADGPLNRCRSWIVRFFSSLCVAGLRMTIWGGRP